jgi:hypothetical protein
MKDYSKVTERLKQLEDPWAETLLDPKTLDTSGCPSYRPTTIEKDDGFNVPLSGYEPYRKDFRTDTASLNPEIISTLAATPNLTEDEQELVKQYSNPAFTFYTPGYKVHAQWTKSGWLIGAEDEQTGERKFFRLGDVGKLEHEKVLTSSARYLTPKVAWRPLTENERDLIARMTAGATTLDETKLLNLLIQAAEKYCTLALEGHFVDGEFDDDITAPQFRPLLNEASWFVIEQSFLDLDSAGIEWMKHRLGDRPPTINALYECYRLLQAERKKQERSLLFNPPEPEPDTPEAIQENLESLSDEQITDLRTRTIMLLKDRR